MKKIALAVMAMALALGGVAKADLFDYAKMYGGVTIEPQLNWQALPFPSGDYDMDTGLNVGAALGWDVAPQFSIETDLMYTHAYYSCCNNNLETFSIMLNGIYHIDIGSKWTPYIGAGAGIIDSTYSTDTGGARDWVFGAQGLAGISIPLQQGLDLSLEYKYQWSDDASDSGLVWGYKSHNVDLGLTFHL
jgi:opacity protein-like surface antigen